MKDFILVSSGKNTAPLTADELAFCEAVAVSEMYAACMGILQADASALYASAWNMSMSVEHLDAIPVALAAKELADKISSMIAHMKPLLDPVIQRDQDTSRSRQHASQH